MDWARQPRASARWQNCHRCRNRYSPRHTTFRSWVQCFQYRERCTDLMRKQGSCLISQELPIAPVSSRWSAEPMVATVEAATVPEPLRKAERKAEPRKVGTDTAMAALVLSVRATEIAVEHAHAPQHHCRSLLPVESMRQALFVADSRSVVLEATVGVGMNSFPSRYFVRSYIGRMLQRGVSLLQRTMPAHESKFSSP
jgi:hypothetical protein